MTGDRRRAYHKRDRLRQLRAFCHAARFESITRSAEHLSISQPAVSLHVRDLEHELEAALFERIGPRIALTEAGRRLYRLAMPLVEAMDGLATTFAVDGALPTSGEVHLSAGPSGTAFVLPPYLKRFRDACPGARLRVTNRLVREGLELLSAGEVDFVVGAKEPDTESFLFHSALSYNLVLITPEDHPLARRESVELREASQYPAIIPSDGTYSRQPGDSIAHRFRVRAKVAIEASGWEVIKGYVASGLGVAVVPDLCLREGDRVRVIPFGAYAPARSYGIFTRRGVPLSPLALRLVRMIVPGFLESS